MPEEKVFVRSWSYLMSSVSDGDLLGNGEISVQWANFYKARIGQESQQMKETLTLRFPCLALCLNQNVGRSVCLHSKQVNSQVVPSIILRQCLRKT